MKYIVLAVLVLATLAISANAFGSGARNFITNKRNQYRNKREMNKAGGSTFEHNPEHVFGQHGAQQQHELMHGQYGQAPKKSFGSQVRNFVSDKRNQYRNKREMKKAGGSTWENNPEHVTGPQGGQQGAYAQQGGYDQPQQGGYPSNGEY
jgi:hypothetical protein